MAEVFGGGDLVRIRIPSGQGVEDSVDFGTEWGLLMVACRTDEFPIIPMEWSNIHSGDLETRDSTPSRLENAPGENIREFLG